MNFTNDRCQDNTNDLWTSFWNGYLVGIINTSDYSSFGVQLDGRTLSDGRYRYGFGGYEADNEVSGQGNSYTTHFRQYDPRLARWKILDPLMGQFPWMSPYVAFDNNPVYFIDPLGSKSEGHWYGTDGSYIGDDGKKDDNVYVIDSDNVSGTGNDVANELRDTYDGIHEQLKGKVLTTTAIDYFKYYGEKLDISQSDFLFFSGVVKDEESGSWQASNAIAGAVLNNQEQASKEGVNRSLRQTINKISTVTNKKSLSVDDNSKGSLNARKGTLLALMGTDYSNGATHWDGFDFAGRGPVHPKGINQGYELTQDHYLLFKVAWPNSKLSAYSRGKYKTFSSKMSPGLVVSSGYNKGRVLYKSSAVHGSTIFWKPNRGGENNKGYVWKYLFK